MQLTIDLTNQPAEYGKRVIAMIEAYYGLQSIDIKMDKGAVETLVQLSAAQAPSVPNPFPVPTAPSTVAAAPSSTAPVEPQASSPAPSVPLVPAAPTASAATAPVAPVAPTSPAGIELDTDGLPWDARIHSSSKAKNADGRWRAKKGLNDGALVARIQAELRAAMAVPAVPVNDGTQITSVLMADGVTVVPIAPEVPAAATPFVPPPPPVAPIQAPAATIPIPPAADSSAIPINPTTLPELMPLVTSAMIAGKVKPTALLESLPEGIADLPTLAQRPDLIPQVWERLKAANPGVWS